MQAKVKIMKAGNYEVLAKIGDGGMGAVFKARHMGSGEIVAIKFASHEVAIDPVLIKRCEREFQAIKGLNHRYLVRALDYGLVNGVPFLVMEYVEGENLAQQIARRKRLPEEEAVRCIVQAAEGLQHAHLHNLIHRDIKPENILLTPTGDAKVADFGLAKDLAAELILTQSRRGMGTSHFMAPEQFDDAKHADVRSDIFALGATCYMAVTGKLPFGGQGLMTTLKKKVDNDIIPPLKLVPELSKRVDLAIRQALWADPRQRPASCLDFVTLLTGQKTFPSYVPLPGPAPSRGKGRSTGESSSARVAKSGMVERRKAMRHPCNMESSCGPINHPVDQCWPAEILDISTSGIGMKLGRRFESGTVLRIQVGQQEGPSFMVTVKRVQEVSGGQWQIGCHFTANISEKELRSLCRTQPNLG